MNKTINTRHTPANTTWTVKANARKCKHGLKQYLALHKQNDNCKTHKEKKRKQTESQNHKQKTRLNTNSIRGTNHQITATQKANKHNQTNNKT